MDCRGAGLEARRGPPRSRSADCTSHCMITDRPRRLAGVSYIGYQRYSLTLCTDFRRPTFQSEDVVNSVLEQLRQTCSLCTFALTAYCFMHDHLHVLATGQSEVPISATSSNASNNRPRSRIARLTRKVSGNLGITRGFFATMKPRKPLCGTSSRIRFAVAWRKRSASTHLPDLTYTRCLSS